MGSQSHMKRRQRKKRQARSSIATKVAIMLGLVLCLVMYHRLNSESARPAQGRELLSGGGSYEDYEDGCKGKCSYDLDSTVFLYKNWWLAVFVMLYMFIGLALVCDYFEASLDAICEFFGMSEDVAGATLMAMGSSAPELFTSIMAVFVSENNFGVGTIVGSAVFNVLIIIGLCAIFAPGTALDWWPLTRDSVYYCITILALLIMFMDYEIHLEEGIICVVMYVGYVVLMMFNKTLERKINNLLETAPDRKLPGATKLAHFVDTVYFEIFIAVIILGNLGVLVYELINATSTDSTEVKYLTYMFNGIFIFEFVLKHYAYGFFTFWRDPINAFDGVLVLLIFVEIIMDSDSAVSNIRIMRLMRFFRVIRGMRIVRYAGRIVHMARNQNQVSPNENTVTDPEKDLTPSDPEKGDVVIDTEPTKKSLETDGENAKDGNGENAKDGNGNGDGDDNDDDDDDDDEPPNPFKVPKGALDIAFWIFSFPIEVLLWVTIPDCRRPIFKKAFALTFIMSILHIASFSYFMVWMAEILGWKAEIPEIVMGLTFLAAGTSIPDTLASVSVARQGKGNMAIANSIGSNIFDILIGLGLPWVMKIAIANKSIQVGSGENSKATIILSVMILFITVALVVLAIHFSKWVITRSVGLLLLFAYALYVTQAILIDYGIVDMTN